MSPSSNPRKYTMRKLLRKNFFTKKCDPSKTLKRKPRRRRRKRLKPFRNPGNQISQMLSEMKKPETPSVLQKITERLINNDPNPESTSNVLYPCGLINQSNYCYVNSTIQALLACPLVYNLFFDIAKCFIMTTADVSKTPGTIARMAFLVYAFHCRATETIKENEFAAPFEAYCMYDIMHDKTSSSWGEQQDAEEFFSCVINKLNEEMVDLVKKSRNGITENSTQNENIKSPIADIFGGLLKFNTYRHDEETSSNSQCFLTLPLDLKDSSTIFESLEALTAVTQLEGIVCSKTNKQIEAYQQTLIESLPKVLVCQIKCFEYDLDGPKKIQKQLEFPLHLEIDSEFLASNCEKQQRRYKLIAVIYHKGISSTRGHYVASTYNEVACSWIYYNDDYTKLISENEVLKPEIELTPYLLFYQTCGKNNEVP